MLTDIHAFLQDIPEPQFLGEHLLWAKLRLSNFDVFADEKV